MTNFSMVRIFRTVIAVIALDAAFTGSDGAKLSSEGITCDLSPLILPERSAPIHLKSGLVNVLVKARLDFQSTHDVFNKFQNIYLISEETTATIPAARQTISNVIKDEVGALPNEPCGVRASLGAVHVDESQGDLLIRVPLKGEKWGCVLGMKAQFASDAHLFRIVFAASVVDSKFVLVPDVSHLGDFSTKVRAIDDALIMATQSQIQDATVSTLNAVKEAVARIQARLDTMQSIDTMQSNLDEALAPGRPIYHPSAKSFQFRTDGDDILLVQQRTSEARETTTCAIRKLALEKWTAKE